MDLYLLYSKGISVRYFVVLSTVYGQLLGAFSFKTQIINERI